jgi:hypothetical protein
MAFNKIKKKINNNLIFFIFNYKKQVHIIINIFKKILKRVIK